jgi:hypothetical protein
VTSAQLTLYGIYTTSDATCQTGWVKSFLNSSPSTKDVVKGDSFGSGPTSAPINCALIIAKNSSTNVVAPGTYTGVNGANQGGGSDSACNNGVTQTQHICRGETVSFPAAVVADAAALSTPISLTTTCPASPTGNEIIPIYLSVNSACTGQATIDGTNPLCGNAGGSGPDAFNPPESTSTAGSSAKGLLVTSIASAAGTNVYFTVKTANTMGGDGNGQCTNISPGRMFIHQ